MKLQIAADTLSPDELLEYFSEAKNYIDILELGTPFLLQYGAEIISKLKKISPNTEILCDSKIMDAGYYEAEELFKMGADYVTILSVTENSTIKEAVKAAKKHKKMTVADMICVHNMKQKAEELEAAGIDVIAVHTGVDQQKTGRTSLGDLKELRQCCQAASIAVAGGITYDTLKEYIAEKPEILVVGGGIFKAENPVLETKKIYSAIKNNKTQIVPSILEADYSCLGDELKKIEDAGAKMIHIDVMDGQFVPNLSLGLKEIQSIRSATDLIFDVHLMIFDPEKFIDKMKNAGADRIIVHYEACKDAEETLKKIKRAGMKAGIALKPATSCEILERNILENADIIHIMTVEPGLEGQIFQKQSLKKIEDVKKRIKKLNLQKEIEVDGGITEENIQEVIKAGANIIVSGKSLFKGNLSDNIRKMIKKANDA